MVTLMTILIADSDAEVAQWWGVLTNQTSWGIQCGDGAEG